MNRRAFFERSGRWFSAALLGLLGGYLVLEREVSSPASCGEHAFCQECLKFNDCEKPQAAESRSASRPSGKQTKNEPDGKE